MAYPPPQQPYYGQQGYPPYQPQEPYQAPVPPVVNPKIPFTGQIQNGMRPGKMITINGSVPRNCDRFTINLQIGASTQPRADIPFHFSVRVKQGVLVRNTLENEKWQKEERNVPFYPFKAGDNFEMMILAEKNEYKVAVNGKHLIGYVHRVKPLKKIDTLAIAGDVKIYSIKYEGGEKGGPPAQHGRPGHHQPPGHAHGHPGHHHHGNPAFPPPAAVPPPMPQAHAGGTIMNPTLPYSCTIPGGMYPGRMIFINGIVLNNPDRFRVNFGERGKELSRSLPFHFNSRPRESAIVCNTRKDNGWGTEERRAPYFPFTANTNFEIIFLCQPDCFKVAVNGRHLLEYAHRISYSQIDRIDIGGDIRVTQIRFQ
ncbi:galectin-8-like [Glandiceps talaboti]